MRIPRLTADEMRSFDRDGFVGPFELWPPDAMRAWWREQRRALMDPERQLRAAYPDNPMNYDRHLDVDGMSRFISSPEIVGRLQSLIGPDILCWRTEIFPKNPGDAGTGWHQVETYAIGKSNRPMLRPTERRENQPTELTVWTAATDATIENGCMRFLPGSHKQWYFNELGSMEHVSAKPGGGDASHSFFGYNYDELKLDPEWQIDESQAVDMEMKAGQFVIFTARCIHGSRPNTCRRQRIGFAMRVVPTHIKVYDGMKEFDEFGHHFDLDRHGCVQISGVDAYGHNRIKSENARGVPFETLPGLVPA